MVTLTAVLFSYLFSGIHGLFVHDPIKVYQVQDNYVVYGCYPGDKDRPQIIEKDKAFAFIPSGLGNLNIERGISYNGKGAENMCAVLNSAR